MNIISHFICKYKERNMLRSFLKRRIEIVSPASISDYKSLNIESPVYIGPKSWMNLRGKLYIGSGTIIGPRIKVHTSNHRYEGELLPYDEKYIVEDTRIGQNVWIGADVTLLPGITIGEGAIIGACSCVSKDVPPLAVVAGNPARIVKYRDREQYEQMVREQRIYLTYKYMGKTCLDEKKRILYKRD